ncbi:hypothetical protein APUTEX25_001578, partial [Auxenochlorella protothecoides]
RVAPAPTEASDDASSRSQVTLRDAGKLLCDIRDKSKDVILKTLKQAEMALSSSQQADPAVCTASADLCHALSSDALLRHSSTEVQLYTACCLCHLLKLHAPECPYDNATLKRVFLLFSQVLGGLADPASPLFSKHLLLLDTLHEFKCCVLAMDLDLDLPEVQRDEVLCTFISSLLSSINDSNEAQVFPSMLGMLCTFADQADLINLRLLEALLKPLLRPAPGAAGRLLVQLLGLKLAQLAPSIQDQMAESMAGRTEAGVFGTYCMELLYQVHCRVPRITTPLLPTLADVLATSADEARRGAATDVAARLLLLQEESLGAGAQAACPRLLDCLLARYSDTSAGIRGAMAARTPALAAAWRDDAGLAKRVTQ